MEKSQRGDLKEDLLPLRSIEHFGLQADIRCVAERWYSRVKWPSTMTGGFIETRVISAQLCGVQVKLCWAFKTYLSNAIDPC